MSFQAGDIIADRYRLLDTIGDGAMGAVYRAEHMLMNKTVAVKILHANVSNNNEMVERFKREAQSAASIEHANICTVTDFDTTESGDFFLVMEFLEGETLQARIERKGKLSALTSIRIMQQLLSVLECAHGKGIVHRDVKPENVFLIQRDGSDDFVKLLDFGIARSKHLSDKAGEALTQAGLIYGTPQYISPEQACGKTIDFRADLYACGVILYEMVSGERPFNSDNLVKLLHMHSFDTPPALSIGIVEESQRFNAIIQRLMKKNPDDRYQSAGDVMLALDDILVNLSPTAPDASIRMTIAGATLAAISTSAPPASHTSPTIIIHQIFSRFTKLTPKTRVYLILIGIALLVLLIVSSILIATHSPDDDYIIDPETNTLIYTSAEEKKPILGKLGGQEHGPQDFNYEEKYKISYDSVLSQDRNIVSAVENLFAGNPESSLASLEAVYDKYKAHPNYLRLIFLTQFELKKREESLKYLSELLDIVPDASRNPHIQKIIIQCLGRKELKEKVLSVLGKNKNVGSALGLSDLLISLPTSHKTYDAHKKALYEIYESLPSQALPLWRKKSVEALMLDRRACKERFELYKTLEEERDPEFIERVIMPLYDDCYGKRKNKWYKSGKSKSCQECMKSWLREMYNKNKENDNED